MEGVPDADLLDIVWLKGPAIKLHPGITLLCIVGAIRFCNLGGMRGIDPLE